MLRSLDIHTSTLAYVFPLFFLLMPWQIQKKNYRERERDLSEGRLR